MAVQPTLYPEWATDIVQEVKVIDGITVVLNNKLEPNVEWKTSGEKYRENLPRQYVNYNFDLIDQWTKHLDGRYAVGDIHLSISVEGSVAISARLGGTWVSRGTQGLGTITANVWEKTA